MFLIPLFGKNPRILISLTLRYFLIEKRIKNDEWKTLLYLGKYAI